MKKLSTLIAVVLAVCTVFAGCGTSEIKTHNAVVTEQGAVFKGNKIMCYLNGEYLFVYTDHTALTGTGWGIRCNNGQNATISNIRLTSAFEI